MPRPAPAPAARCVWMDAGLIRYRLCDRDFDCERCLLNAALCGDPPPERAADDAASADCLPGDRIYCPGHTWLRATGEDAADWRFGLDPFAAATLGRTLRLRWPPAGSHLDITDAACTIAFPGGAVVVHAPVPCRLTRPNDALREDPQRLLADPCGNGWIAELRITEPRRLAGLLSPAAAADHIRVDITRFRQAVALELLSRLGAPAGSLRAGRTIADVPRLLGGRRYRRLLRDFIH